MNETDYVTQISAWIDPLDVFDAVREYSNDKEGALKTSTILFGSETISNPDEAAYRYLISRYLDNFYIPKNLIAFLRQLENREFSSEEAWDWLANYRFTGTLAESDVYHDKLANGKALLSVTAEDCVIDILLQPLTMLSNVISTMAETWKYATLHLDPKDVFLEHSIDSQLGVYIETEVAKAYGISHAGVAGEILYDNFPVIWRYRAIVTQVAELPVPATDISALRFGAQAHADMTRSHERGS